MRPKPGPALVLQLDRGARSQFTQRSVAIMAETVDGASIATWSVSCFGRWGVNMAGDRDQELPPAKRRRLIFLAVLRSLLIATVLVVLYYLLPLERPWSAGTAARLLVGLLVFAGVMLWQVRAIAGARYPALRAAEALGLILPLYLVLFASTYFVMERTSAANFTQPLTRTDALYFTVTVLATVGFGDITPKSEAARVVLIVQMLGDLALLGAGIRILLGAVQHARQQRSDTGGGAGPAAT